MVYALNTVYPVSDGGFAGITREPISGNFFVTFHNLATGASFFVVENTREAAEASLAVIIG